MERATIDGLDVRVHRGGEGPPLLYLHSGLGEVGRTAFVATAEERWSVLAPELPGFGGSEAPTWHRVEDAVFFLRALLDHFDWPPGAVCGSSLGGWLGAELAVWYPERVRALVLFAPLGIRVEGAPVTDIFMAGRETMIRGIFSEVPDPLDAAFGEAVEASDGDVILHFYKALEATARIGWNPFMTDLKLRDRLARCAVPTTVVWGEGDGVVPRRYAEAFTASLPAGRLVTLPSVGHVPVVEQPAAAHAALVDALEGAPA